MSTNYRNNSPKTIKTAHAIVAILRDAPAPLTTQELVTELVGLGFIIGTRELRRACKYARDHGAPVMCTRDAEASRYWLEHITANSVSMPNRYLDDAYRSLVAWHRGSARGGGRDHRKLRDTVGLVIQQIGHYEGLDSEQVHDEMRRLPDPAIDAILGGGG
jgi:hypothetical protein